MTETQLGAMPGAQQSLEWHAQDNSATVSGRQGDRPSRRSDTEHASWETNMSNFRFFRRLLNGSPLRPGASQGLIVDEKGNEFVWLTLRLRFLTEDMLCLTLLRVLLMYSQAVPGSAHSRRAVVVELSGLKPGI